jgi:hypothetical protein
LVTSGRSRGGAFVTALIVELGEATLNTVNYVTCFIVIFEAGFSEDSDYTSDVNFPINGALSNVGASQYQARAQPSQLQQPFFDHTSQQHLHEQYYYDTGQHYQVNYKTSF